MADGRKIISTTSIVSFIIRYGIAQEWTLAGPPIPPSHQVARSVGDWTRLARSDLEAWTLGLGLGLGLTRTSIGHKWHNL